MSRNSPAPEFIGILPAAGIASRLHPSRYLKELLPVTYLFDDETSTARPVPVVSLSLRALRGASVRRCVVTISDRKPELMRYLGDGSDFGLQVAYVQQITPTGLAPAVDLAHDWVRDAYSCLLLPDTIVRPSTAMASLCKVIEEEAADLVLGVFPTNVPEQLGPVRFDSSGRVLEVQDKPPSTDLRNTWTMAVWSPGFSDLLHTTMTSSSAVSLSLGEVFNIAVQTGMKVKAVWFAEGSFVDIGTVKGLSRMLELSTAWDFLTTPDPPAVSLAGQ